MKPISWCSAVIKVERRAHAVHTLRFPAHLPTSSESRLPSVTSDNEIVQNIIAQAFSAIINLKHLFLLGQNSQPASIKLSTLASCTFSLCSFAGQVSGDLGIQEQLDFLLKHPTIEYWVPTEPFLRSVNSFPTNILPNLRQTVLVRPSLMKALGGRPIESLMILFIDITHSRAVEYTHGSLGPDWSTIDIISNLSRAAPNLKILTLGSLIKDDSVITAENQQSLVDAVARFCHLKILVLNTYMCALQKHTDEDPDPENPLEHSVAWEGRSPAQARQVATQFMTACPSLRRLSFPDTGPSPTNSLTYILSGTKAKLDGFYIIDNSGWWLR
ncbi:hypothetical protein BDZ94DRAFT_192605 [Collybia nuda]|uniref:Uncharacterized protein n=1 Tax=Collybia nuda TaxID=64659 RepID=A0A9P5XUD6_9AGAR|nr:hypothetical protein BDZ94DRAFT_192605 [Collybia nuda]